MIYSTLKNYSFWKKIKTYKKTKKIDRNTKFINTKTKYYEKEVFQIFLYTINFKIYMEYQIIKSSQNTLEEENKVRRIA